VADASFVELDERILSWLLGLEFDESVLLWLVELKLDLAVIMLVKLALDELVLLSLLGVIGGYVALISCPVMLAGGRRPEASGACSWGCSEVGGMFECVALSQAGERAENSEMKALNFCRPIADLNSSEQVENHFSASAKRDDAWFEPPFCKEFTTASSRQRAM